MNSKWYLVRLFHQSKFLFLVVTILFALHINANFLFGGQQSPFFLWNLYAEPVPSTDTYSFYEVQYNGNKMLRIPHTWEQPGAALMTNQLNHYLYMLEHGQGMTDQYIANWNQNHPAFSNLFPGLQFYPDSTQMKVFPKWFGNRLEQYIQHPVTDINILKTTVRYKADGGVQLLSSVSVCRLK